MKKQTNKNKVVDGKFDSFPSMWKTPEKSKKYESTSQQSFGMKIDTLWQWFISINSLVSQVMERKMLIWENLDIELKWKLKNTKKYCVSPRGIIKSHWFLKHSSKFSLVLIYYINDQSW